MRKDKTYEQVRTSLGVHMAKCQLMRAKEIKLIADLKARNPRWQWQHDIIATRLEGARSRKKDLDEAIDRVLNDV